MQRLTSEIKTLKEGFERGNVAIADQLATLRPLQNAYASYSRELTAIEKAQAAQTAAMGRSISYSNDWTKAIRAGAEAAKDSNQQLADMARLQQALGAMEKRSHDDRAETAAYEAKSRAAQDEAQALRETIALQQALGAMEERTAAETLAGAEARIRTRGEGTRAVKEEVAALSEAAAEAAEAAKAAMENAAAEEAASAARGKAYQKAAAEADEASRKINAAFQDEADAAAKAASKEAEEFDRLAAKHAEMWRKWEADDARHAAAEAAEMDELATSHQAFVNKWADEEERRLAKAQETRVRIAQANRVEDIDGGAAARAIQGVSREQDHLNSVLAEAAVAEAAEARAVAASSAAHRTRSVDVQRDADGMTTYAVAMEGVARTGTEARSAAEKFAYMTLNISHAAQDLQFGVGAVLNNIPLVTSSIVSSFPALEKMAAGFGGPAGIAGGIMLVSVGLNTLYNRWDQIKDAFGVGIPRPILDSTKELESSLEKAGKEFEELGKKTRMNVAELARYKELADKIEAMEKEKEERRKTKEIEAIKSKGQEAAASGFRDAVAASGGGDAATDTLIQAIMNAGDATGQKYTAEGVARQAREMMRGAAEGNLGDIGQIADVVEKFMPANQRGLAHQLRRRTEDPFQAKMDRDIARAEEEDRKNTEKLDKERIDAQNQDVDAKVAAAVQSFGTDKALGGLMGDRGQKLVAGGATDEAKIADALAGDAEDAIRQTGLVPADILGRVAREVVEKGVKKMLAELSAQAAENRETLQAAAARVIREEEAKAAKKADAARAANANARAAAGRKEVKADNLEERGTIAQKLAQRFPGVSDQQAQVGAKGFQDRVARGENPRLAQTEANAQMLRFTQQNLAVAGETRGFTQDVVMGMQRATMQLAQLEQAIALARGQMKKMNTRKPAIGQVIPGR